MRADAVDGARNAVAARVRAVDPIIFEMFMAIFLDLLRFEIMKTI
jgi:hypothetical protein